MNRFSGPVMMKTNAGRPFIAPRSFHIRTFGCQMNENDSEHIAGVLAERGLAAAARAEDAEFLIVNTCSVREKSEDKLYSLLGRWARVKRKTGALLGVVGCTAQLHRDRLWERVPDIDFIVGPDHYAELPEILLADRPEHRLATSRRPEWEEVRPRRFQRQSPFTAFVTVMEGCDNFCSYCVVPYTRGREKYRPWSSILDEVRGLAQAGYREVQLLGQNVNSYRDPQTGRGFADLLRTVGSQASPFWVRFLTSHPKNFGLDIVRAMAETPSICPQLHLPLQAGATSVLERMNRGYSGEDYLALVSALRRSLPAISLSTDIIVGFPGETEQEFQETLTMLDAVRFTNIFSFRYSPRPRTEASRQPDDVPAPVKQRRLLEVQALQKNIQTELNASAVGRVQTVLATGESKKPPRALAGRNQSHQVVNFTAPQGVELLGRFVEVLITSSGPYSLRGALRRVL